MFLIIIFHQDFGTIKCEIPQGSVLGLLLFLIYIIDQPNAISKLKSILFADVCQLCITRLNP